MASEMQNSLLFKMDMNWRISSRVLSVFKKEVGFYFSFSLIGVILDTLICLSGKFGNVNAVNSCLGVFSPQNSES